MTIDLRRVMLVGVVLTGAVALPSSAAAQTYRTEQAFVDAMARRMTAVSDTSSVYTERAAARRCLTYISGAHGTPSLRQEIGRTNRNFALSDTQKREFKACALQEGYRLR